VYRYVPETKDKPLDECVRLILEARKKGCKNLMVEGLGTNQIMGSVSSLAKGD